ncbi:MAG TPA: VOC family protein [Actinomycetes bacterium]|nr:VOC family protein [Actinomycetes bacterium]
MDLSLSHCFVTVQDPDESLAFYRGVLGLELRNDVAMDGFRWLTLTPRPQPGVEIVLVEPHAGRSKEDGDALQALLVKGSLNAVIFSSPDIDATFERVRASGAEVLQEPMDQPWGARDCAFRDPSGNMIRISQEPRG